MTGAVAKITSYLFPGAQPPEQALHGLELRLHDGHPVFGLEPAQQLRIDVLGPAGDDEIAVDDGFRRPGCRVWRWRWRFLCTGEQTASGRGEPDTAQDTGAQHRPAGRCYRRALRPGPR
jgi:hypothetical protein